VVRGQNVHVCVRGKWEWWERMQKKNKATDFTEKIYMQITAKNKQRLWGAV